MPTVFENKPNVSAKLPKEHTRMGLLTCYAPNPDGVHFETQEEEEHVLLFLRQHPIVNVGWASVAFVLFFAPTFIFPWFLDLVNQSFAIPIGYVTVGTLFWYVGTFGFVLAKFLGWYFNIYIVTDQRVIDIDFQYLLYKRFSQAELDRVQDITYDSGGFFATFFNYGNIVVETAGESPNLEFGRVPYPEKIVETIRRLMNSTKP